MLPMRSQDDLSLTSGFKLLDVEEWMVESDRLVDGNTRLRLMMALAERADSARGRAITAMSPPPTSSSWSDLQTFQQTTHVHTVYKDPEVLCMFTLSSSKAHQRN